MTVVPAENIVNLQRSMDREKLTEAEGCFVTDSKRGVDQGRHLATRKAKHEPKYTAESTTCGSSVTVMIR